MTQLGLVDAVQVDMDARRVLVDVSTGIRSEYTSIPFEMPASGIWIVPQEGDIVEVADFGQNRRVARSPHTRTEYEMPASLGEGDVAVKLSDSVLFHFSKNADGSFDVTLETDGALTMAADEIDIGGDKTLHMDADTITIGSDGNRKKVATEDHTHDVTLSDGTTATTDKPSDNTDTTIE